MRGSPVSRSLARAVIPVAAALVVAGCGSGAVNAPAGPLPSPAQQTAAMRALRAQSGKLLAGGVKAFRARLAALRGHPIVVNQWASWCGPCRFEFPFFQRLAAKYSGRVAFLGVDSRDNASDAAGFLHQFPVPYPHYEDVSASIARTFHGGFAWPTTAFFDARGRLAFVHLGAYANWQALDADIRHYATNGGRG